MFKNKNHKEKIKDLFVQEPYYVAAGLFFGFPECCIDGFLNDNYNHQTKVAHPEGPYRGTGFVPCIACANMIEKRNNWNQFQKKINNNRKSHCVFPIEQNYNAIDRFFYALSKNLDIEPVELASCFNNKKLNKIVKEEKKLEDKKHIEHNMFLKAVNKLNQPIDETAIFNIIVAKKTLHKYVINNVITEMTYLALRSVEKISYSNLNNGSNHVFSEILKDRLGVIMRNFECNAETLKKTHEKLYNYCIEESSINAKTYYDNSIKYIYTKL